MIGLLVVILFKIKVLVGVLRYHTSFKLPRAFTRRGCQTREGTRECGGRQAGSVLIW